MTVFVDKDQIQRITHETGMDTGASFKNKRIEFAADKAPPDHPEKAGEGIFCPKGITGQIFACVFVENHFN